MKYLVVTGGMMSGLGKGTAIASIGRNLKNRGLEVTAIKIDPYINIDAGTMSPYQHGEVFVLEDGSEVDLDLGNYERFLDINLTSDHSITTGKIYRNVILKERKGDYLGNTVQIIPHVTDEIESHIRRVAESSHADVCLVEVGGTVGDIESMPFIEAVRRLRHNCRKSKEDDCVIAHVTLCLNDAQGEQKTKPTQHSVNELKKLGIIPDVLIVRSEDQLYNKTISKLSMACDIPQDAIISAFDADVYDVPKNFEKQWLTDYILRHFNIDAIEIKDNTWNKCLEKRDSVTSTYNVAIVGKYTSIGDCYFSIKEALKHCAINNKCNVNITPVDSEGIEDIKDANDILSDYDGIIVPGGFGERGTDGKLYAIQYAREQNVPFLGICMGMQLAVIEFVRNVMGLTEANSTEFDNDTPDPVVCLLSEQENVIEMGGTMRLGNYDISILKDSLAFSVYGSEFISERHRHRFEINPMYFESMEKLGLKLCGFCDGRAEIIAYEKNTFHFATQFHPEYQTHLSNPSPVFNAFLISMINANKNNNHKPSDNKPVVETVDQPEIENPQNESDKKESNIEKDQPILKGSGWTINPTLDR